MEYDSRWAVSQARNAWLLPAPSVRMRTFGPGLIPTRCPGS